MGLLYIERVRGVVISGGEDEEDSNGHVPSNEDPARLTYNSHRALVLSAGVYPKSLNPTLLHPVKL